MFDIIGDIHGHREPLERLLQSLGYDAKDGWRHPDSRHLIFLGDLVDRGPDSLGVATLVRELCAERRAHCLMGNHEYNLATAHFLGEPAKSSNKTTLADINEHPIAWAPVLEFLAGLPLAIELPGLRLVHAGWHTQIVERLRDQLAPSRPPSQATDPWSRVESAIVLGSPFRDGALVSGLPAWGIDGSHDTCHEVLIKGFERRMAAGIIDAEGVARPLGRVRWWFGESEEIATDVPVVFGHYWNLPPSGVPPQFAPPHVTGSREDKEWYASIATAAAPHGSIAVADEVKHVCVDYNGVAKATGRGCVGAFRWPERVVAWSS